jgi:hypothetical protein
VTITSQLQCDRCNFLLVWGESGLDHPSDRRLMEPMEDHSQGRLCVYVHLVVLTVTGCLRTPSALT